MADAKVENGAADTGLPPHLQMFAEGTGTPAFETEKFLEEFLSKPDTVIDPQTSLKRLSSELRGAKVSLQNHLIDLLNSNYRDFIGLPTMLAGTSDSVDVISRELASIRIQVDAVSQATHAVASSFEAATTRRAAIIEKKETLLMLKYSTEYFDMVKRLLDLAEAPFAAISEVHNVETCEAKLRNNSNGEAQGAAGDDEGRSAPEAKAKASPALNRYNQLLLEKAAERSLALGVRKGAGGGSYPAGVASAPVVSRDHQKIYRVTTAIERAARSIARLKVLVDKTKAFRIAQNIASAIPSLEERLMKVLKRAFLDAVSRCIKIKHKNMGADADRDDTEAALATTSAQQSFELAAESVANCLRAFNFTDQISTAEETVREELVAPIISRLVTKQSLSRLLKANSSSSSSTAPPARTDGKQRSSSKTGAERATAAGKGIYDEAYLSELQEKASKAENLDDFFGLVLRACSRNCAPVLMHSAFPFTGFQFVTRAIATEVLGAVEERGGEKLFAFWFPEFLRCYLVSQKLVRDLAALCPDNVRREGFLTSKCLERFQKKWDLNGYSRLQFQGLRKGVDAALKNAPKQGQSEGPDGLRFELTASGETWNAVARCWEKGTWIGGVTHRFYKATIQLLRRYSEWVREGLGLSGAEDLGDGIIGKNDSPKKTKSSTSGRRKWSPAPTILDLLCLQRDLDRLVREGIAGKLVPMIIERISEGLAADAASPPKEELETMIKGGFEDIRTELAASRKRCMGMVSLRVSRDCMATLTISVPRIKAKYSMTGEPVPTKPSSFVQSVLDPLQKTLEAEKKAAASAEERQEAGLNWLVDEVGKRVTARYAVVIRELLQVVEKTEAILSRRKKKKSSVAMSDADKIRLQLYLDVNEFASQLARLGTKPSELEEVRKLVKLGEALQRG
eukprot:CAMPEP_0184494658 /NCGR_PEP_ID=MMETSP0113_2-20130426/29295_1 /TAXON_ID=91329 /ORGANISM="Norrisiella sphaerica, Strain BC52" /LENGTH=909 /DNA_ID=CAMNT_0026880509 /DNA_START=54 /DNA_END=2783 /DNA_ORIENTATION=-